MNKWATTALAVGLAATSLAVAPQAGATPKSSGAEIVLLDSSGVLSVRDAAKPLRAKETVQVSGLAAGDRLVGIDVRPATGQLFAISQAGQLYTVDLDSGRATAIGAPVPGVGAEVGFDFNPTVDRIRLVTSDGTNLRLNPDTGAVAAVDGDLAYADGEGTPEVAAAAYTNSVAGATSTALYVLDAETNALYTQGSLPGVTPAVSPNTGTLIEVADLRVGVGTVNGFDISGTAGTGAYDASDYTALAAVSGKGQGAGASGTRLVEIDLETGEITQQPVRGLGEVIGLTFLQG